MRFLLSFILAAFASRLKPIVTAMRARCADMSYLKTPPRALRPLTSAHCGQAKHGGAGRNTAAVRHVLTGSLLLAFGVLTMLAPPVESHAPTPASPHNLTTLHVRVEHDHSGSRHDNHIRNFFGGDRTAFNPKHFEIRWIRIYKNPKITQLADFTADEKPGDYRGYSVIAPTGFETRQARLYPSLRKDPASKASFWVNIDPGTGPADEDSGGLLDDPDKPGNSGVIDGPGVTVVPGDIVAIAINVKLTYYKGVREFITATPQNPNPTTRRSNNWGNTRNLPYFVPGDNEVWVRDYSKPLDGLAGGTIVAAMWIDGVGVMNPNYLLEDLDPIGSASVYAPLTHTRLGHAGKDGYHTLVYQFTVPADPDIAKSLNDGDWLRPSDNVVTPFNVPWGNKSAFDYVDAQINTGRNYAYSYEDMHEEQFGFFVPFDADFRYPVPSKRLHRFLDPTPFLERASYGSWTYLDRNPNPDENKTAAYQKSDFDRNGDGIIDFLPPADYDQSATIEHYMVPNTFYEERDDPTADGNFDVTFPHHFPPTYDTSKGAIYYPRVVVPAQRAVTPEIVGVPAETQTGDPFQVTLRFQRSDENLVLKAIPLGYSEAALKDALATLPSTLTAAFEHGMVTRVDELRFSRDDITLRDAAGTETPVEEPQVAQFDELLVQLEETRGTAQKSKWFQVTVEPTVLGFVGDMTLRVPADVLEETKSGGNLASAAVTVPLDIPLPPVEAQSEVVAPESGVYLAGDEITVEVSFATDELRYEGENPPYVTIYLGEQVAANARHALWQKGSERSGSTIVRFAYVLQASDPFADSVSVAIDSSNSLNSVSIPRETTLTAASGLLHFGTAEPAVVAGAAAPVSDTPPGPERLTTVETTLLPVIAPPQDESDPKAAASSVPLKPIVFNEIGNGSGDANDWLELRNVSGSDVSLKDWELSVVQDGKKEDTSLIVFVEDAAVSVPANGLLLITNMPADKTLLAGGANKGLSHASLVDAGLSLPDDGKFLLILRNAKEKLGLNEAFIDVAGGGGSDTDAFVREQTGDYDTHVWPLQVREAPGGDTEDALSAGKVWARAKADIVGYHKDAWGEAVFTGIGYDRKVSNTPATTGTPGYPNGAVKTGEATPQGAVTFSEIMFDTAGATLPQWIELYNNSKTEALNLNRWKLEIQNRRSADLVGRPIVTLTLQEKVIQPNQTLLIVAGDVRASSKSENVFPADRVYNLLTLHDKNLRIKSARDAFLSAEGFYLKLSDSNGTKIDEIGNLDDNRRTDGAPLWVMPVSGMEGARSSLVRRYTKGVAENGMERAGWAVAAHFKQFAKESLHYGHADDIGTPGYRKGGALPVELSSFTVTRAEAGAVIVTWTTESEVDNAGFNLRRSLQRDSGFTLLNPTLIAGAGTTGERQTYTFTDTSAKPGVEYYYQIEEVSFGGKREALVTRRLAGPVSPANRALTTFGEVKKAK